MVKILLVDDDADNLMSMEVILEKEEYTFFKALSGKDALTILLKEEDISLILLDVRMPIMDGYETAELIYQHDKLSHIPIIFITGQNYEDVSILKGYKTGAVDYICKPVNLQILRSKVAVFAELHKKNQLLIQQENKLIKINEDLLKLNQELENRVSERSFELEKLNKEHKDLNLSKDKFLSVISHDLRNPLTALLISSDKLSRDTENHSFDEVQPLAKIIHRTSNKILQQLNELVDWAKSQHEKTNFNPERLQLAKVTDQSLELLKADALQKDILLENKVPFNVFVHADTLMLRSILQNLVTNAIKYTSQGGKINVTAEQTENMIEICIADNGVGMEDEIRDNLFSDSESVSCHGSNNEKGSGVGLILVKDFVTAHGGAIHVESETGKGTCVKFTVPQFN